MSEKPLLTLAVCCYKFERFIHEAVEAALAQTYRPLEIVISDDCSPDASWDRIVETVERLYPANSVAREVNEQRLILEDGLTLVLNRNPRNLGLALHENRLFELSSGEWIAFQSGDDISVPDRIEEISKYVINDRKIRCLHSMVREIHLDSEGKMLAVSNGLNKVQGGMKSFPYVLGASAVYHRDVFDKFGPIGSTVRNEDQVLPLRAALLGTIVKIDKPLVLYRKHTTNLSGNGRGFSISDAARYRKNLIFARYQSLVDLYNAEINGAARRNIIKSYRALVEEDILVQRFLADMACKRCGKIRMLFKLAFSWRYLCAFISRVFRRYL